MKKLLLSVFALCSMVGASAYETGNYVYTTDAKYKVAGENLVTNGSFKGLSAGWTNAEGGEVSAASWAIVEGAGRDGGNAMVSLSADAGNVLARVMTDLKPATYSVSYWVKGEGVNGIILNNQAANYAGIYVNNDASITTVGRMVSDTEAFSQEWTQVVDTVNISDGEFLVFYFDQFAVGTAVTDFEVHEISQVYDDRAIKKDLAYIKELLARDDFKNKMDDEGFSDIIAAMEDAFAGGESMIGNVEDMVEMESFMTGTYQPIRTQFLEANSANMLTYISYGDIAGWPKFNNGDGKKSQGDWKFSGTTMRWGHGNGAVDGNLAYPGNYDLLDGTCMIEKAGLDAGTYLFALEVKAEKYNKAKLGTGGYYTIDYNQNAYGGKLFIGNDTIVIDTIPNRTYERYYIVANVAEGDTLRAGFRFPGFTTGTGGGRFGFRNAELYLVGSSKAEQDLKVLIGEIKTSQNSFKVMLDSAIVVSGKTAEYPWGMQEVRDSIALAQPRYEASLSKIDAEGNVLNVSLELDAEYPAELDKYMGYARTSMQNLYALNAPIANLKAEVKKAKDENLNNEEWAKASASARAALEDEVAKGEAMIAAIATIDDPATAQAEADAFTAQVKVISDAIVEFQKSGATYGNPGSVTIAAPDFTGQSNKKLPKNGWTGISGTNMREQDWKYATWNAEGRDYHGRGYVNGWRGNTVCPSAKVYQEVTLTDPGVYELAAFVYTGSEVTSGKTYRGYYTILLDEETGASIDTTYDNSKARIFMGLTGVPDSVLVHSQFNDDIYRPSRFSVYYVKESAEPEVLELGFEAREEWEDKNGANMWGFGGLDLFYGGDKTQYDTDLTADLANYVAMANEMLALPEAQAEVNKWMAIKLQRYVKDAAAATTFAQKMNTIHRLKETMDRLNILVTGIEGVETETVLDANAKGVYSITGVKFGNELKGLQKGLYIINGKKYIVK